MLEILVDIAGQPDLRRPAVVCIPHAGAGVGLYSHWHGVLGPTTDFIVARLPGREELCMEEPIETMEEMVSVLAVALAAQPDRDFVLYGHCTGGLVAYELAQRLRRQGQRQPRALVVSSAPLPGSIRPPFMHDVPDEVLKKYMISFSGGDPDDIPDELWELVEPMIRADFRAAELASYSPDPLDIPIVVLCGADDDLIVSPPPEQWASRTRAAFRLKEFPASHFLIDKCGDDVARELADIAAAPA